MDEIVAVERVKGIDINDPARRHATGKTGE